MVIYLYTTTAEYKIGNEHKIYQNIRLILPETVHTLYL